MYDLAIIGGGPAGYVAAENAAAKEQENKAKSIKNKQDNNKVNRNNNTKT